MKLTTVELLSLTVNLLLLSKGILSQEFQGVCGGTQTERHGTLTSPNYPSHYPVNKLCVWILNTVEPYGKVRLIFDFFELEPESVCRYDYVLIRDGSSPTSHMIGKFCGSSNPATITSSGRSLWVEFRSDASDRRQGFLARWETEFSFPHETRVPYTNIPSPTRPQQACGGDVHGTHGIITSRNYPEKYPNNEKCKWTIIAPRGAKVQLNFDTLNIENGRSCRYDYLEIRDGADTSAPFMNKLCGRTFPATVTSTDNMLHLEFNSDDSDSEMGFRLEWYAIGITTPAPLTTTVQPTQETTSATGGCDRTIRGRSGIISSPNYPNNYPSNKMCTWTIKGEAEEQIELQFEVMDLERDATCRYDYVEIRDGSNEYAAFMKRVCGNTLPQLITSTGDSLYLEFFSDASDTRRGFYATWRAVDRPGYFKTPQPPRVTTRFPEEKGCGGRLTALTGVFQSPKYPQNYPTNTICQWKLEVPHGYNIRLEFSNFNLEADTSCRFDYLVVYDGPNVASPQLGRICGNTQTSLIPTMDSTSNKLTVVFNSDTSISARGFEAYWTARVDRRVTTTKSSRPITPQPTRPTGCGGSFVQPSGDVSSPGYPHYYPNNMECIWVLGVPGNKKISIGFEEFDLEGGGDCQYDFVELRDGNSRNAPLLGKYCGSTAPLMVMGSTDRLWLRFHSNGFLNGKGFEATWTTEAQIIKPIESTTIIQGDNHRQVQLSQSQGRQPSPSKKCGRPLGLENKQISDAQLSSSSIWMSSKRYGPKQARLNNRVWPQGWVANSRDKEPWLKVKLNGRHIVTGIATQGYGNQLFNEWVTSYIVSWYDPKHKGYVDYREQGIDKVFDGNTDRDSVVRHTFKTPINAEEMVIRPKTWKGNVGLRIELYGCALGECMESLGLANGFISDSQLKASSSWNNDPYKYGAHRARLNITSWPQGWTASEHDRSPWLQVNLQDDFIITQVATQGFGGSLNQWVKSYKLTWMDDSRNWHDYYVPRTVGESEWRVKSFRANRDRNSIVRHVLKVPIRSKVIRFWPQERHGAYSMRADLYGCSIELQNGETQCRRTGNRLLGESHPNSVKHCTWQLTSESAQGNFNLNFDRFSFQSPDPTCTKDYLEVRNGYTEHAPLIGKFCGNKGPNTISSSNGALWIRFVVSGQSENKVSMKYEFVPTMRASHYEDVLVNTGSCGVRSSQGRSSESSNFPGQWPWQVALTLTGQTSPQCGGAFIARQWVLTAAHCFKRFQHSSHWTVQAGVWDFHLRDGKEQELYIKAIYIHPHYNEQTHQNDVALVYLERPVTINDRVKIICLGSTTDLKSGKSCSVAGWGSSSIPLSTSRPLMHREIPLVSNQQCNSKYGGRVDSSMICAGNARGGGDSCYGDGGSPLMCRDSRSNKWVISGISSWGEGCRSPGTYEVYTNVASQKWWIDRVTSRH